MSDNDILVFLEKPVLLIDEKQDILRIDHFNQRMVVIKGIIVPQSKGIRLLTYKNIKYWEFDETVVFRMQQQRPQRNEIFKGLLILFVRHLRKRLQRLSSQHTSQYNPTRIPLLQSKELTKVLQEYTQLVGISVRNCSQASAFAKALI